MTMFDELSDYYFLKALDLAKNADLSGAVWHASASMGINKEREDCRRLAGLCYYKLGNYTMAEYCFNNSEYYIENIKELISRKKELMSSIKELADKKHYKRAAKELEKVADKSINEYNYLGCLYAILHKKEKAIECFLEAYKEDKYNKDTLHYMGHIQFIKKRWWEV